MELSVLIPVFNEEQSLPELLARLHRVCIAYRPYEIIAIDDGSTDNSYRILKAEQAKNRHLKVLRFLSNAGKSDALDAGFHASSGRMVVTIDSDLQNPPEEIPKLLQALDRYHLAIGWRHQRNDTLAKRIASRVANSIRARVLQDRSRDAACALKAFRRETLQSFTLYKGLHRFFPALAQMHGFRMVEIAVEDHPRKYGYSKYQTFFRGVPAFIDMLAVWWMKKRKMTYTLVDTTDSEQ